MTCHMMPRTCHVMLYGVVTDAMWYPQKDLCRKVLRLYQDMVVSWMLDKAAWEYLLSVLLCHTWKLLTHKDTSLGLVLATTILKVC